jgi:hypothetical protein
MIIATPIRRHVALPSALAGLWLILALPLGLACVFLVARVTNANLGIEKPAFFLAFLPPYALAGGLWGRGLGRIAGYRQRACMMAGAIGVALPTGAVLFALTYVEQNLGQFLRAGLPVHVIFAIAFALAALMLAGTAGLALGLGLRQPRLAGYLALAGGGAGSLAFLVVDVSMDLLGFRVGAPNAEQRATMLVVAILGLWATAIVGSAVIGHLLAQFATKIEISTE